LQLARLQLTRLQLIGFITAADFNCLVLLKSTASAVPQTPFKKTLGL
jgi:hypothetical protein